VTDSIADGFRVPPRNHRPNIENKSEAATGARPRGGLHVPMIKLLLNPHLFHFSPICSFFAKNRRGKIANFRESQKSR